MDAFRGTWGMSPHRRKDLRRSLEHWIMWNELVCQFRPLYNNMIQQFFLPTLQERDLDNVWLQQHGATAHTSRVSMGVLRAAFLSRMTDLPARTRKLACLHI
ncbi:hypothetical protein TNCV_2740391 [Trichonephila clavipes]|nr:hypothetical protein TNCV_2740391 [Trichonephila clavipes]